MEIAPTSTIGSATDARVNANAAASQPPTNANTVDYQSFLRLLIAQLQNQDPLNPVESTEYMSQLASFSSVEQAVQTNAKLDSLLSLASLSQAESLIGRTVTSGDGLVSGEVTSIMLTASGSEAILKTGDRIPITSGVIIE